MSREEQGRGQGRYCYLYQPLGFASSPQFPASVTLDCLFNCPLVPICKNEDSNSPHASEGCCELCLLYREPVTDCLRKLRRGDDLFPVVTLHATPKGSEVEAEA